MTCPNFKVKMIKLHDTKFYCCDEFKSKEGWRIMKDKDGQWYVSDDPGYHIIEIFFCPFCGSKLR